MTKKSIATLILATMAAGLLKAQTHTAQYMKGWPSRTGAQDIREHFADPPKGYGNVPFYWWSGDNLDMDRLTAQLAILAASSTDGLCVSYNHSHPGIDLELNANGHGGFGMVESGDPYVLSSEWMKLWAEYSKRCADYGIGLGMDDYVVASPGNGAPVDKVLAELGEYPGRLKREKFAKEAALPEHVIICRDLGDSLNVIYAVPSPELHPDYGRLMVEKYFQPFEDAMDAKGRDGMNYFFQDELIYDLDIRSWCEGMRKIFMDRKGYDILPHLDALFATKDSEVGPEEAKFRLDYAEVLTQLAEERYFKPIYDWHADRGLIYGCDNEGRGLHPTQYLDYFRAVSWFTAPGNDAPARGSSFIQTKVSSSISHLYGRPRTWLEAFHSMGWDANGGVLVRQLDHHMIAGGNLVCLHGLYYSTHGGWWEWAPPCFHFRMPYWPHMKTWLKYAERMSFVLSQGSHVCDIAILYPTETMQAYPEAKPKLTFDVARNLSDHGLDYDFIDYQSLQKATVGPGTLTLSDESYKVLVLAGTRAMHKETQDKVEEFAKAGGIVIKVDGPEEDIVPEIRSRITPDFSTGTGVGKVLHRRVGDRDVYMVMDVEPGDVMSFRSTGKAEIWDAFHGTVAGIPVMEQDGGISSLTYDGAEGNSMLIVFSPGEAGTSYASAVNTPKKVKEIPVKGDWDIEIIPTLDNSWGDFRLPKSDGKIGVEAREFTCTPYGDDLQPMTSVYGYGPYMLTKDIPSDQDLDKALNDLSATDGWEPYIFSWQYGVFDSPGSQGYHGLKAKVDDRFLILDRGCHQVFKTGIAVPADGSYRIVKRGAEPYRILIDRKSVTAGTVELTKGMHSLVVAYSDTPEASYSLEKMRGSSEDRRERGMVMLYPAGAPDPKPHGPYEGIVASSWYRTGFVPFKTDAALSWTYGFETAPGTISMEFEVAGTIDKVKVGGKKVPFSKAGSKTATDGHEVNIYVADKLPKSSGLLPVKVEAVPDYEYPGAAFFTSPVKLECEGGKLAPGDWTMAGAMKFFSGGVKYSKEITLDPKGGRVLLDLGDVDATCEVSVNGAEAGVLLRSPYTLDITDLVAKGKNKVEVLVYSSLSNHYQTIPSPYKGTPRAGLIGPVNIKVER